MNRILGFEDGSEVEEHHRAMNRHWPVPLPIKGTFVVPAYPEYFCQPCVWLDCWRIG